MVLMIPFLLVCSCQAAWSAGQQGAPIGQAVQPESIPRSTPGGVQATTPPSPGVEAIVSMREHLPTSTGAATRKSAYKLSVDVAVADWLDTGIDVAAGEEIRVQAEGSASLSDGRRCGSGGVDRGWKDLLRQLPSQGAKTGELIGRVSSIAASVPFPVGASGAVTMPTSGRLYLRSNLSEDLTGTGTFKVDLRFSGTLPTAAASVAATPAPAISGLVTGRTFDTIPRRVSDESGSPGDMVNFALAGSELQVKAAFATAGWVPVDKSVGDAVLHGLLSTLSREAYTEMPMSTLFLFGRSQDLSFARGDPVKIAAERHHLRIWRTGQTVNDVPLWVGSATHDIGFERDQRNGKTTHKIDPKIDDERQFLLQSFDAAAAFTSAAFVTPTDPLREAHTATGGSFFSDGRVLILQLR